MKAFCVGLPGWINPGPLSMRSMTDSHDPVEYTDHSQSWQIQIDFNRQRPTVKVINDIERMNTTATDQGIMHKIDRPVLVQRFLRGQGLRTGSRCIPLRRKFSFSRPDEY